MPLDPKSRRELAKRQVKRRDIEHDATKSDKERKKARREADFLEKVRNRLNENQSTDSNNG